MDVPVYTLPEWSEDEGKGVDDYIQNKGIEDFREELLSQSISFGDGEDKYGGDAFDKKSSKPPKPDIVGKEIAEQYRSERIELVLKTYVKVIKGLRLRSPGYD